MSNVKLTGFANWQLPSVQPTRPLRLVFLTSIRDVGACDRNGQNLAYPDGTRYMQGSIEATVQACLPRGPLHGVIEVVLVITDDIDAGPRPDALEGYPALSMPGRQWIHPFDLKLGQCGNTVVDRTINVPSNFRKLPRNDTAGRAATKLTFEQTVLRRFNEASGDVLISDHYMAQLEHLHIWLPGRVLNIHPAITARSSQFCLRGPTPTADAIARAQELGSFTTGATLHFVNSVIDDGPAIAIAEGTSVYPSDIPQQLRDRNYRGAKNPLLVRGLEHYVRQLYPYLSELDLTKLEGRPL